MRHPGRRSLTAAILTMTAVLSACAAGTGESSGERTLGTSISHPPYSPPPVAADVNPLNGIAGAAAGPVFGVKIDDTAAARPQIGISSADIVYVEQVEGGLTRLMAVFATALPAQVGPVRSVRASDTQILTQYGRVGLAFSGGAPPQLAIVAGANVVDASAGANPQFYSRSGTRPSPYNLMLDLSAMAAAVPVAGARSMGLLWGSYPALAASPSGSQLSVPVGTTVVDFRFDPATGRYVRFIDGQAQFDANGPAVSTANVIVLFCQVGPDGVGADVNGSPTIGTSTVGSGPAAIFRDGHRIDGVWSRATAESGTTLTDAVGRMVRLAPGGAWVVLAASGAPLSSG